MLHRTDYELYRLFLSNIIKIIRASQEQIIDEFPYQEVILYWQIGQLIALNQADFQEINFFELLPQDLKQEFPDRTDFKRNNLYNMAMFFETYQDCQFVKDFCTRLPWSHNVTIAKYVNEPIQREWYIKQAISNRWICKTLRRQINNNLYLRQEKALTNFQSVLPKLQAEEADRILKNPYIFDLDLPESYRESELEDALTNEIKDFLIELGFGFAYMGNQFPIRVGNQTYILDLLFYHVYLHCFVVVELKVVEFIPEFIGKMNFYLSAVDDQLRKPEHNPTIGIILCKSRNETIVRYALKDVSKPIAVSTYQLSDSLPFQLESKLPSVEQLEMELEVATAEFER